MEKSQGQRLKGISEPEGDCLNGKKTKTQTPLTQAPIPSQNTQHQRNHNKIKHPSLSTCSFLINLPITGTKKHLKHLTEKSFEGTQTRTGTFLSQEKLLHPIVRNTLNPLTNKPTK